MGKKSKCCKLTSSEISEQVESFDGIIKMIPSGESAYKGLNYSQLRDADIRLKEGKMKRTYPRILSKKHITFLSRVYF